MKHRSILTTLAFMSLALWVDAGVLTPEAAFTRARRYMPQSNSQNVAGAARLVKTLDGGGEPAVYLFATQNDGYVAVSADDACEALLGYGITGDISEDSMAPGLKYWLQSYADQVAWARKHGAAARVDRRQVPQREAIEPMTKTRWNQGVPYNDECPEIDGTRCVTGCVATALAQVMKYHNWPVTGTGTTSYAWNRQTLSIDYGATTFDWDNMLDTYGADATAAQRAAVAKLMYANGVGVNMSYTTTESSATSMSVAALMVNHYGYDKGVHYMSRDYYGLEAWEDSVYSQLKNYGPVQYSGQSNDGGHSFVFDGYASDGYFHVNWGWGGMSDGYFLLTALDPGEQGIGGSTSGYNFQQDIIAGVRRPVEGSQIYANILWDGSFVSEQTQVSLGSVLQFQGPVYNFGIAALNGQFGLKLVSSDGTVSYIEGTAIDNMQPLTGVMAVDFKLPSDLDAGVYIATPAALFDGKWKDIPVKQSGSQSARIAVQDSVAYIETEVSPEISIEDVTLSTSFYIDADFEIKATLVNNGTREFGSPIEAVLLDSVGNMVAYGKRYPVDIVGGQSESMIYVSSFTAYGSNPLTAGNYLLSFINCDTGGLLVEPMAITLHAAATPTLTVTKIKPEGDARSVDKNNMRFTAEVSCTSGYFGGMLTLVIFPYSRSGEVTSVGTITSDPLFVGEGQTVQATFEGSLANGQGGHQYFAMVYMGQTPVSGQSYFKLSDVAAVDDVTTDKQPLSTQIYTLSGVRVPAESLRGGYYIVRTLYTDGSVTVSKKMIR